ncbi:CCAAT/enhancer-binding protein zeta isoform X2 [Bombyx mandarina]|uniref:CCAAT/enhancer-binding protein zeta isoform X2 n=1 Tax=Bombyx mandarina TaxID=7092 RepID=A0A6J2JGR4_BOMMA|nr:CCAAT/enhancer-binding protein zeta isoform X2 [Bombyx mandarina]
MKHKRFEENILIDEAYTNYGQADKNADDKKGQGIAKNFAESLEYGEKKKWFHQLPEEPVTLPKTLSTEQIEQLRKEATSALHGDTLAYETKTNRSGSSDHQWAKTLLNKGAIGDRVAAATILIQDNPLYNLTALRNLINNVKPAKKKDGIVIIDALSELLISELLIPDVKLRTFEQHPLGHLDEMTSGNKQTKRNILKLWYYEDQLKELYGTYVDALNKFAHDTVDANKEKSVSAMSYLLMHHPEREKILLTNIINKLGDPSQGVASKVIYHLCQIIYNHPNMKGVVLAEIEKMLFRTNISPRAQYYGVCFLNQFYLGKDDSKVAESLIRIYFSFFKASIKKGEIDSRLMSAILTGVKRAYPFADKERLTETQDHIDSIHRLVHLAGINISVHALALLFQISDASTGTSDRYYSALYKKLTNSDILNTTHTALLFSLVYKSLKQDKNIPRVVAFVKRLLQLCCYVLPAQACGMIFLLSRVLKDSSKKEAIKLIWNKREVKEEIKSEDVIGPQQDATENGADRDGDEPTDCAQDEEVKETKKVDLLRGDKKDLLLDDDEEESYVDLKIDGEGNVRARRRAGGGGVPGWFHARVGSRPLHDRSETETKIQLKKTINMDKVASAYNPLGRSPQHAGAELSAYTELLLLSRHFHPTVQLFAKKMLSGVKSLRVNSISYLNEDASKIPVDEKFLYDFLQKRRGATADEDDDDASDADSINSEDFEQYLDSITGSKRKDQSDEEELDYLSEMATNTEARRKKQDTNAEDELADDDDLGDDEDEDDDAGLDISADEDEPAFSGDEDELLLEDSDDEDPLEDPGEKNKRKSKFNLKGKDDLSSLFASAEEFSTLLEDTAANKKQGSSQAVSNADNSSLKQLAWEDKRNNWIKGYNKKILGNNKSGGKFKHKMADRKKTAGKNFGGKIKMQENKFAGKGKRKGGTANGPGGKKKRMK